jgi:hypothetical protein
MLNPQQYSKIILRYYVLFFKLLQRFFGTASLLTPELQRSVNLYNYIITFKHL